MSKYNKEELALIILDSLEGFEYKHKSSIISCYKNIGNIFDDPKKAIKYASENLGESLTNVIRGIFSEDIRGYAKYILQKLKDRKIECVTCLSENYPQNLNNYPFYPLVIYARGNIELLNAKKKFAIVGSRKTLPPVIKRTEEISKDLSSNGIVIVSGSATGGDRSALMGASESGNVISVLASGHDYIYPQSNRTLIEKIAENGLVISEYPPETTSAPWRFPLRNRLISALSDSVLIASGETESGTRHTAKFAEAFSKNIYAFPYSITEKSGEICNQLIKMNKAQLVETSEDIATFENIELKKENAIDFEDEEREVLYAMDGECDIDSLSEKMDKPSYEIMAILSMLEIKGAVARGEQNTYTPLVKLKKQTTDDFDL